MNIKHSPGPWTEKKAIVVDVPTGESICEVYARMADDDMFGRPMADANAKLICAAPSLLNACLGAIAYLEDPQSKFKDNRVAAWRAIHKAVIMATGEKI